MGIKPLSNNVLICPLDWGLGHTSRILPIIFILQQKSYKIYVSCSKKQYYYLKNEGINFEWIPTKLPEIRYRKKKINFLNLLNLIQKIYTGILRDKKNLRKILKYQKFDFIISDNRYGCYHSKIYSIIVTHQLSIKLPTYIKWAEKIVNVYIKYRINKFDACWVPDVDTFPKFAGDLSVSKNIKPTYIELLSRFEFIKNNISVYTPKYDVLAIISGPEPQKTIFYNILLNQMKTLKTPCAIVCGNPETTAKVSQNENVTIYNYANTNLLYSLIKTSNNIVARSGYSTIMDLLTLKRTAILVPTPGQTEQEYLANYYQMRKLFVIQLQDSFNLKSALTQLSVYNIDNFNISNNKLNNIIENLIKQFHNRT
jgi:uncharacterized protein (TIGR00661 family)